MKDYLFEYHTPEGFDILRLFNDGYFLAIKLLYNNRRYVSATKLLMSAIDTVAYLDFGDSAGNFSAWLDTYADLQSLNVSSEEVWELRNSLVHMTNLDSRKVLSGKVQRLQFYVGFPPANFPTGDGETKYFGLWQFIQCIGVALQRFAESFNNEPKKFENFFSRYDRIISDTRYFEIELESDVG